MIARIVQLDCGGCDVMKHLLDSEYDQPFPIARGNLVDSEYDQPVPIAPGTLRQRYVLRLYSNVLSDHLPDVWTNKARLGAKGQSANQTSTVRNHALSAWTDKERSKFDRLGKGRFADHALGVWTDKR